MGQGGKEMLVLARKHGQSIFVGDAEITIVEVRGDVVRLGIEAAGIPVYRREVWEKIRAEREEGATPSGAGPPDEDRVPIGSAR
jgi:carbon storage regulator CsrA